MEDKLLNMATPDVFFFFFLVLHKGLLSVIDSVVCSELGFRKYEISYVDSGERLCVAKHELGTVEMTELDLEDIPDMNWDADILEGDVSTVEAVPMELLPENAPENAAENATENVQQQDPGRHAVLTEDDIGKIAEQRLAENTTHQTRWAVALFKGIINHFILGNFFYTFLLFCIA